MTIPKYLLSGDTATVDDLCRYLNSTTTKFHSSLYDCFDTVIDRVNANASRQYNASTVVTQQRVNLKQ